MTTLERFAEERLLADCLGPRVERRQLQFFERFRPPGRNETPSHGHEPTLAVLADDRVDSRSRTDIISGLRVHRRLFQSESVQPDDFFPRQLIGGAPAHGRQHIALLDVPATLRRNSGHAPIWTTADAGRATASNALGLALVRALPA